MSLQTKIILSSLVIVLATTMAITPFATRVAKAAADDPGGGCPGVEGTLDIATEQCTLTAVDTSEPGYINTVFYAEHAYPSKSTAQLSQVQVIGHVAAGAGFLSGAPPGYAWARPIVGPSSVLVKDGAVAVECGYKQTDSTGSIVNSMSAFDRVTFTLVR